MKEKPNGESPKAIQETEIITSHALEALTRGEVDVQIQTAKRFPRSIKEFRVKAKNLATLDADIAQSCFYTLPRGKKTIEGPSIRLAEIVLLSWGNCAGAARIIQDEKRFVIVQGVFKDYENNTSVSVEVRRRTTDKNGRPYNDDMKTVASNAACSIALRNAVFHGIPGALWKPIYMEARRTAIGEVKSLDAARKEALNIFTKLGASTEQVCEVLGVKGVADIGIDELITLKGLQTALDEGDTSFDQVFSDKQSKDLDERLKSSKKKPPKEKTSPRAKRVVVLKKDDEEPPADDKQAPSTDLRVVALASLGLTTDDDRNAFMRAVTRDSGVRFGTASAPELNKAAKMAQQLEAVITDRDDFDVLAFCAFVLENKLVLAGEKSISSAVSQFDKTAVSE